MKRTPIVLLSTIAGVAGVLALNPDGSDLSLGASSGGLGPISQQSPSSSETSRPTDTATGVTTPRPSATHSSTADSTPVPSDVPSGTPSSSQSTARPITSTTSSPNATTAKPTPTQSATHSATPTPSSTPSPSAINGSATGSAYFVRYGYVQVKVTVSNGKITDVQALQLPNQDGRSYQISQTVEPMLRQQVLQAQSGNISGVSGATYTSTGYYESLQSALSQLGFDS